MSDAPNASSPKPDPGRPRSNAPRTTDRVADAPASNWFDQTAPSWAKPYGHLARFDRPIGGWLLLFPCWWSQALAELNLGHVLPNVWFLALFAIGAFVMRGAGCTHNDIIDRDYDKRVARTASRPIPSGRVTVLQAFLFAVGLSLIGLLVLLQFNSFTILLGIASLGFVAAYPFAKRYTHWAQLMLGLTFKWGALVGWAAIAGSLSLAPILLYVGAILWTIGYDTIYAHQDKEDDAVLGLKSTALLFGARTREAVAALYAGAVILWLVAAWLAGAGWVTSFALALVATQFAWQVATLDIANAANCLERFRSNSTVGWLFFLGVSIEMLLINTAKAP
jgi:4-hydroxybenzoate polyprenyltransferase